MSGRQPSGAREQVDRLLNRRTLVIILFTGIACLIALADRTPLHYDKYLAHPKVEEDFNYFWRGVTDQTLPGPSAYRVLVPYLVLALERATSMNPLTVDLALKMATLIALQLFFFRYLSLFSPNTSGLAALAGVLIMDCCIAFALAYIMGPSTVETSALLDVVVFTLALSAIHANRFVPLCIILVLGMFNRETPLLLLPVFYLNDRLNNRDWRRSVVLLLVVALPYIGLRMVIEPAGGGEWLTLYGMKYNIPFMSPPHLANAIAANLHVGLMLGPLIVIGLYRFHQHPVFLRTASYVVPVYIAVMYVFGTVIEARLWLPALVFLIALAVDNMRVVLHEIEGSDRATEATHAFTDKQKTLS